MPKKKLLDEGVSKNKEQLTYSVVSGASSVEENVSLYSTGRAVDAATRRRGRRNSYNTDFIILPGAADKPEGRMTSLDKMNIVREGVSKKDLQSLKIRTALDYDKLAKALSVTRATLRNKKSDQKFNAALSERIVALADIYSYGYEVFEDDARFNEWMFRSNRALGGKCPYEFIDNQFGREEVRSIIGRIDYGVYS